MAAARIDGVADIGPPAVTQRQRTGHVRSDQVVLDHRVAVGFDTLADVAGDEVAAAWARFASDRRRRGRRCTPSWPLPRAGVPVGLVAMRFPMIAARRRCGYRRSTRLEPVAGDHVATGPAALCDDEAERLGVLADAGISRDDGDRLWCIAEKLDRGQMDGIERPDWFDGERAADSSEDRSVNVEDERAPLEGPQGPNGAPVLLRRSTCRSRAPG